MEGGEHRRRVDRGVGGLEVDLLVVGGAARTPGAAQLAGLAVAFSGVAWAFAEGLTGSPAPGQERRWLGDALGVVLVILLIVYRSPVLPFIVLMTSMLALGAASFVVYVLAETDVITLNGQSQGILFILVIGATTDYSLLLVARYREELRRTEYQVDAMRATLRGTVAAILAWTVEGRASQVALAPVIRAAQALAALAAARTSIDGGGMHP